MVRDFVLVGRRVLCCASLSETPSVYFFSMSDRPSKHALELHRQACEEGEAGYVDPDTGLFVMTSVYLRQQGECCGSGCRHCPFSTEEQLVSGRPDVPAWPWPPREDVAGS